MSLNTTNPEIENICDKIADIPRVKGLVGILILSKTGSLFFSKVDKRRKNIKKNIFQIAGFISAIMIYSQDIIGGKELGLKLEDIDLYIDTKNEVIFTYFVEKQNCSENIIHIIHLIFDDFLDKYYDSYIKDFKGDLTPFHSFENIIDQYFEI